MGRKSLVDKKAGVKIDDKRKEAIEKFFGLTEKVLKHIEWSITCTKVCTNCSVIPIKDSKEMQHVPGKAVDAEGKCAFCHGSNLVPDVQQRNWATGEIADRIAPKPKAVEMTVDKTEERKELEQEVKKLKDAELDKQLEVLGVIDVEETKTA